MGGANDIISTRVHKVNQKYRFMKLNMKNCGDIKTYFKKYKKMRYGTKSSEFVPEYFYERCFELSRSSIFAIVNSLSRKT